MKKKILILMFVLMGIACLLMAQEPKLSKKEIKIKSL